MNALTVKTYDGPDPRKINLQMDKEFVEEAKEGRLHCASCQCTMSDDEIEALKEAQSFENVPAWVWICDNCRG